VHKLRCFGTRGNAYKIGRKCAFWPRGADCLSEFDIEHEMAGGAFAVAGDEACDNVRLRSALKAVLRRVSPWFGRGHILVHKKVASDWLFWAEQRRSLSRFGRRSFI
jgi:hypothetical protein